MKGRPGMDFSFSGLKTAVRLAVEEHRNKGAAADPGFVSDIAASFQAAAIDILIDRAGAAMNEFRTMFGNKNDVLNFVVAGGVAANKAIGSALSVLAAEQGFRLSVPPPALCTDNGAMVAWAGIERLDLRLTDALDSAPRARWPLETLSGLPSE
jgi:N6-L-threonylcarbamoyladenine synthase